MSKISFILLGITVLLIVGIAMYGHYYIALPGFYQMSLYNLIQLSITVFIAWFIAHYLRNKYSDRQTKKQLFISVSNDISLILEKHIASWLNFLRTETRSAEEKTNISLTFRRISNKITILEQQNGNFHKEIDKTVEKIRGYYDEIKQTITGDGFDSPQSYPPEVISKIQKLTDDLIFVLDDLKLKIFD